jgi:hypothetical protein
MGRELVVVSQGGAFRREGRFTRRVVVRRARPSFISQATVLTTASFPRPRSVLSLRLAGGRSLNRSHEIEPHASQ